MDVLVNQRFSVAIRCDVSSNIGTGHFMRCLTLADAMADEGVLVRFISRYLPEYFQSVLIKKGYGFKQLLGMTKPCNEDKLAHAFWLGTSQQQDAKDSIQALSDKYWDWIIVDHYALDACWESVLQGHTASKIFVIDDLADRKHDCDLLLDQNLYADMHCRYIKKTPVHCQLLLGPRYALLRNEFKVFREKTKPRKGRVRRILIFFGGVDLNNYTQQTLAAIINIKNIEVDVVVGASYHFREDVKAICLERNYTYHLQTNKMAELMVAADLAIGAGGSTCWERCCLGLPSLVFCTANNQFKQIEYAAQQGLIYAPIIKHNLTQTVLNHLNALLDNNYLREYMSYQCMKALNGQGISNVLATLGCHNIFIKEAVASDSENIFTWRNNDKIREISGNKKIISWQEHSLWFDATLNDEKKVLLIGMYKEKPLGVVRFDLSDDRAKISIYLTPESINLKLGLSLLYKSEQWLMQYYSSIHIIQAYILGINERSINFFAKAGYQQESTVFIKRVI